MAATRVEVEDKPTLISGPDASRVTQAQVLIRNNGTEPVDLGDAKVETGKGFPLAKETTLPPMPLTRPLYAVAAAGKKVVLTILPL